MNSGKVLLGCSLGIFVSYFIYGLIQEKITKTKYGPYKETFTCILSLIFIQCLVNALVAFVALKICKPSDHMQNIPAKMYLLSAFSYIGAMFASNYALKHVNYPTQVLGKSAKPIPVMLLGVLWARKVYPARKYAFVFMITIGVMIFLMKDISAFSFSSIRKIGSFSIGTGELLLLISLTLDGVTGAVQDTMRSRYSVGAYNLMFNMNIYSLVYLIPAILIMNEHTELVQFIIKYPEICVYILLFGLTSAVGQVFIFTSITQFGPLTTSIVTTTRKFFTILASVVIFRNPITVTQVGATCLVFAGLLLDQMYGKEKKM